jgi:hypothetical protein
MDIGQGEIAASMAAGELRAVETAQVQDRLYFASSSCRLCRSQKS